MSATRWVVYCQAHGDYLVRVSAAGLTWSNFAKRAKQYERLPDAVRAAERAAVAGHRPVPWVSPLPVV